MVYWTSCATRLRETTSAQEDDRPFVRTAYSDDPRPERKVASRKAALDYSGEQSRKDTDAFLQRLNIFDDDAADNDVQIKLLATESEREQSQLAVQEALARMAPIEPTKGGSPLSNDTSLAQNTVDAPHPVHEASIEIEIPIEGSN